MYKWKTVRIRPVFGELGDRIEGRKNMERTITNTEKQKVNVRTLEQNDLSTVLMLPSVSK